MRPEEIKKLVGGYATGTLTEAERQALFAAALEDQGLFDELAREQTLHEVLRDPAARAEMLDAVAERPRAWAWWRPAAAALAMAAIAAVIVVMPRRKPPQPPPQIVAQVKPPEPVVVPPPAKLEPVAPPESKPAPPRKLKTFQPPAPASPPPARAEINIVELPKAAEPAPTGGVGGVIGGTPGGVLGGIIGARPAQPAPPPPPVLTSEVPVSARSSFAETVEVMAAAPMVTAIQPSARSLFYGRTAPTRVGMRADAATPAADTAVARALGLRYGVVRKDGDTFVPADPETLTAGDTLALRFTANVSGYLSIAGAKPVALTAMEPYTTPPLPQDTTEVRVIFARTPQTAIAAPVSLLTEVSSGEVYAVNRMPGAPVAFTVAIKRK